MPPVASGDSHEPSIQKRLEVLVTQLLDGAVVPFLGAGVSLGARVPVKDSHSEAERESRKNLLPRVGYLVTRLKEKLEKLYQEDPLLLAPHLKNAMDEAKGVELTKWSEIYTFVFGPEGLCKQLQIELYTELEPLPAHVYLACLAREGLVRQLITTNYDTCIETAFARTFGTRWDAIQAQGPEAQPLAVVHDLETFRMHSGYLTTRGTERIPRLMVNKINGCAAHYRNVVVESKIIKTAAVEKRRAAESILLTERQLQEFRERQWARELLRVTARSRALLFSGFGSEEPQVRHTMLLLVEEFMQGEGGRRENCSDDVAKLPNAPFVQVYDEALKFYQYQPLHGFSAAHLKEKQSVAETLQAHHRFIAWRTATGKDGPVLGWGANRKLPADTFFARLFQLTWERLLVRYTRDESPFVRWLLQLPEGPQQFRAWVDGLRSWFYPADRSPEAHREFGAFPQLLELSIHTCEDVSYVRPAPLWRWLHAMSLPEAEAWRHVPYPCLKQESLQVLATLFLLYLLFGDLPSAAPGTMRGERGPVPWFEWIEPSAAGLRVVIPTPMEAHAHAHLVNDAAGALVLKGKLPGLVLYLVSADPRPVSFRADPGSSLVYQVAVPSLGGAPGRSRSLTGQPKGPRHAIELRRIPLDRLITALLQQPPPTGAHQGLDEGTLEAWSKRLRQRAKIIRDVFAAARAHEPERHIRVPMSPSISAQE